MATKSSASSSPEARRRRMADIASIGAMAEERKRYRRSRLRAWGEPSSRRYRFTSTLVSKYAQRAAIRTRHALHGSFVTGGRLLLTVVSMAVTAESWKTAATDLRLPGAG